MRRSSRNTLFVAVSLFLVPRLTPIWNEIIVEENEEVDICCDRGNTRKNTFFKNLMTLEDVWRDLKLLVPNRGSNGYVKPEAKIIEDFELIVMDMMMIGYRCYGGDEENHEINHGCDDYRLGSLAFSPPTFQQCDDIDLRSLKGKYRIGSFVDRENRRDYCILATTSMKYPWGNVIIDIDTSLSTKNLSFDCPHPKFDAETGEQGIRMLKGTQAKSWIVSGSHRMANNSTHGTCQPQYLHYPSDAAHSIDNCFLAAVAAIKYYYESVIHEDYTSVQLHGMGKTTCGPIDTFFSHGSCSDTVPFDKQTERKQNLHSLGINGNAEKINILQKVALAHPLDNGRHAVAGRSGDGDSDACKLCGSTNVQGRLINGVARKDLCDTFASSYNGRFIQIEQKREYRRESSAKFWNDVFNQAYPIFSRASVV